MFASVAGTDKGCQLHVADRIQPVAAQRHGRIDVDIGMGRIQQWTQALQQGLFALAGGPGAGAAGTSGIGQGRIMLSFLQGLSQRKTPDLASFYITFSYF